MKNEIASYKTINENLIKKQIMDIYEDIAEAHDRKLTPKFLKSFFSLAKEDVNACKFGWDQLTSAMRESLRTAPGFPNYAYFYKKIMDKKNEDTKKRQEADYNDLWSRVKSLNLRDFVCEDDTLYTIGIKCGMTAQIRASDKYTVGAARKALDNLVWKLRKKELTIESDPRKELAHFFYGGSPFKFISGNDGQIYYEDIRDHSQVFCFKDPRS